MPVRIGSGDLTSLTVGIAEQGILLRSGDGLQTIILDKTSTITKGKTELKNVVAETGFDEEVLLRMVAGMEHKHEYDKCVGHPNRIYLDWWVIWFFWGLGKSDVRAVSTSSGYQETMILVKGGYTSDVIVVQHSKPVRFNFRREETAACSEMVISHDFGKSAQLPTGETVPVEFLPEQPGEYEFTCQMGMF